ncbi:MAG: FliH/SctL family protein [Terriglobales bacterium]
MSSSPTLPQAAPLPLRPAARRNGGGRPLGAEVFVYPAAAPLAAAPTAGMGVSDEAAAGAGEAEPEVDREAELQAAFERGRAAGRGEAEARAHGRMSEELAAERAAIGMVVGAFARTRAGYFLQVEGEVVRLALSIARRILHREAQMDPLLLRGAVRLALERLEAGTKVKLRVAPGRAALWTQAFGAASGLPTGVPAPVVMEDARLGQQECVLETTLGETRCDLEDQLREIEQGFFDLVAERGQLLSLTELPEAGPGGSLPSGTPPPSPTANGAA